jgi:hypothetical protein
MAQQAPRRIEYLPLSELKPDPRNPKNHAKELIDSSVGRFGYIEPIVRDERTGQLISGHGRLTTLRDMEDRKESPPEGLRVDTRTGRWLVPVVVGWASRTDNEASAALISLNRTTEMGGWVDDALLDLLDELSSDDDPDALLGVGFDGQDITELREKLDALTNKEFLDDVAGGDTSNPFTESGTWGGDTDEVGVTFPMSPAARKILLTHLNLIKDAHSVETMSEALFLALDLTPPTRDTAPATKIERPASKDRRTSNPAKLDATAGVS